MNMKKDIPAFPQGTHARGGMTLCDYFAAKALQGLLSTYTTDEVAWEKVAKRAYGLADAMMEARDDV